MTSYVDQIVFSFASKGLLIDTNLLLLFLVGTYDTSKIEKFKRTRAYSQEDFHLACSIIQPFCKIIVTPEILAELSNLSLHLSQFGDEALAKYFQIVIPFLRSKTKELYISKDSIIDKYCAKLPKFGFSDISVVVCAQQGHCAILTDDFSLAGYLAHLRCPVINFNYIRQTVWEMQQ